MEKSKYDIERLKNYLEDHGLGSKSEQDAIFQLELYGIENP